MCEARPVAYVIVDRRTGRQVGKPYSYEQRNRCRARVDRLDLEYGAYRYSAQPVYESPNLNNVQSNTPGSTNL